MLERPGDRRALIPYLLFVAALLLTVSGAKYAANTAAVQDRLRFEMAAGEIRSQVLNRLDSYEAATVRVSDTGAGIAADQLPFVFEGFWQADRSTTRKHSVSASG